jgi:hypothetical protein
MVTVTINNGEDEVIIKRNDLNDCSTWYEILSMCVNALQGLTYVSKAFDDVEAAIDRFRDCEHDKEHLDAPLTEGS